MEQSQAAPTTCSSCKAQTAKEDSFFSSDGEILCKRCYGLDAAHAQVERARVAQIEAGHAKGRVIGLIEHVRANSAAADNHQELAAIAAAGPSPIEAKTQCQACRSAVADGKGVYTPNGMFVCSPCSLKMQEHARAEKERYGRQYKILALVALVLIVLLGVGCVYAATR